MAPSEELELNVQFSQIVLSCMISVSIKGEPCGQVVCLFSKTLRLPCPIWQVICCSDVSDLVSFASQIPFLLL